MLCFALGQVYLVYDTSHVCTLGRSTFSTNLFSGHPRPSRSVCSSSASQAPKFRVWNARRFKLFIQRERKNSFLKHFADFRFTIHLLRKPNSNWLRVRHVYNVSWILNDFALRGDNRLIRYERVTCLGILLTDSGFAKIRQFLWIHTQREVYYDLANSL